MHTSLVVSKGLTTENSCPPEITFYEFHINLDNSFAMQQLLSATLIVAVIGLACIYASASRGRMWLYAHKNAA